MRQRGRILPTKQGVTNEALKELAEQHETAFREAVTDISSFVRAGLSLNPAGVFSDLRGYIDKWEKELTGIDCRSARIMEQVLSGLSDYYPCLSDETLYKEIAALVKVPDTGDDQKDYETVRDAVERICKQKEVID